MICKNLLQICVIIRQSITIMNLNLHKFALLDPVDVTFTIIYFPFIFLFSLIKYR